MEELRRFETVGELKKALEGIPDDTPMLSYEDGMEQRGYFNRIYLSRDKFKKVRKETYDRFDHTDYSYECYEKATEKDDPRHTFEAVYLR